MGGGGRWEGGSGWGTREHPWLIHVKVWQKPPQYCQVISLQLKFLKKWEHAHTNKGRFVYTLFSSFCCYSLGPTLGVDFSSPLTAALGKVVAVVCSSVGRRKWHGGAWWAAISGVAQSRTGLKRLGGGSSSVAFSGLSSSCSSLFLTSVWASAISFSPNHVRGRAAEILSFPFSFLTRK